MCTKETIVVPHSIELSNNPVNDVLNQADQLLSELHLLALNDKESRQQQPLQDQLTRLAYSKHYDHLEGGFYTNKPFKQASDDRLNKDVAVNARFIELFSAAAGYFLEGIYSVPAINSAQWVIKNLQSANGAYYAAMTSISSSQGYYALDLPSIKRLLDTDSFIAFTSAFGLDDKNHHKPFTRLKRCRSYQQISDHTNMHIKQVPLALENARVLLALERIKQPLPDITKIIYCGSNARIISALLEAARQFNRDDFAASSLTALEDIQQKLWLDNTLKKSNVDNTVASLDDHLWIIHCLLKRLQFQWDDEDYHWLLQIAEKCSADVSAICNACVESRIFSCFDDFYNLYLLSSNKHFLTIAMSIIEVSEASVKVGDEKDRKRMISPDKYQASQNFIVIRGSKYESAFWLQQLAAGFKPNNHIYAIANVCQGPDQLRYPASDSCTAAVLHFSTNNQHSDIKHYSSLEELLDHYS